MALAVFSAYQSVAGIRSIDVGDPYVMAGMLFGAMLPFLFGAAAYGIVEEAHRQLRSIAGLVEGRARADHARCVDVGTAAAIRRMAVPGVIAVVTPVAVGLLDKSALGDVVARRHRLGRAPGDLRRQRRRRLAPARKPVEGGRFGGAAHVAAAVGDTVGEPLTDAIGPSLNVLIRLTSVVALVLASALPSNSLPRSMRRRQAVGCSAVGR